MIDLTGQRFGRLTVIRRDGHTRSGNIAWLCRCDCGKTSRPTGTRLRQGRSKSCGHDKMKRLHEHITKHGQTDTRLYNIWTNMRARCSNKNSHAFKYYGARGISVCDDWNQFSVFAQWAHRSGYRDDLTIERKDTSGNYEPANCTWIPHDKQSLNRRGLRKNRDGKLWWHIAKANGIPCKTFNSRVYRQWPMERASTQPVRSRAS